MNKKLTILEVSAVILVVLLAVAVIVFPEREYPQDQVIIAFGDSLTVGYGIPPGKNYIAYLHDYTGLTIINAGVTGDNTADALVRLKADVLDKNPSVVMILLGGNDYFDGHGEEVIFVNLRTIIRKIQKSGARVILIGLNQDFVPGLEKVFERLAWEEGVDGYVPNILRGVFLRKDLMFDDIHPNTRGHEIIAKRILPVLERVLRGGIIKK